MPSAPLLRHRSTAADAAGAAFALAAALGLAACGGGQRDAPIGGSVSGLGPGLSLSLQDNGSDTLTVTANGPFAFATRLADGSAYTATVLTQPAGQMCELTNSSGTVDANGDTVGSITAVCVNTASVTGTVSGLTAGTAVTLSDGTVLLPVATNGPFAFPGLLPAGTAYQVTVATQPLGLVCTVLNGVGTIASSGAVGTPVTVNCG